VRAPLQYDLGQGRMQWNVVLGVFGLDVIHPAVHKAALNEKLVFVEIEVVPLKRRDLAHAKTETLGYLYHRAPRLLQCRDDEFELLHSERSWALPALAAAFHANQRNRVSAFVEEFPPRGALKHQVHHATYVGLRLRSARAETIATSRTWREPMKKRRCLIPVNAFYEWPKEGKPPKQPYAFELSSGSLFAFAGIWDAWRDGEGQWLQSYAIVTTEANELMGRIHSRMPVILHSRDYDRWLDREQTEQLPLDLMRPFASEAMEMYEANPKVNNVRNNGPELMRQAAHAAESGRLPL